MAVLETSHHTPYFFNLHHGDTAHTLMLGRTGAGKSFLLNFLITNLQKYDPYTFIFDLGAGFASLTKLFQGSCVRAGVDSRSYFNSPIPGFGMSYPLWGRRSAGGLCVCAAAGAMCTALGVLAVLAKYLRFQQHSRYLR